MSDVHEFNCPDCGRHCRVSTVQRAVQHEIPNCKTFHAHRGNMQEFLRLALMAKGGGAVELGNVKLDAEPDNRARMKQDAIEELHEGLKKL